MANEGLLLVDKPAGVTSHDVVAVARRALRERRIGHAGTLDPFATGLLVLLVGRATRLLPYVYGEPKAYEATVRFGVETDTDDLTGTPIREAPPPSNDALLRALGELSGVVQQVPPAYSAKQVGGRRAYDAARRGESLALQPAEVVVYRWGVSRPDAETLEGTVECSGGTYVRALARDLGRLSGSAAHLARLRRVRSGELDVADAVTLDALREGAAALRPALDALGPDLAVEPLDDDERQRVARGMRVEARADGDRAALVDASRAVLAIAERDGTSWQPRVVLVDA